MIKIKHTFLIIICFTIVGCEKENEKFPLDKRYWNTNDYANATRELKYGYENDEQLPRFDDPESRPIIEKYTDHQNFNIILDDNQLGIKHRNGIAQDFFNRWKDMTTVYRATNRLDKFLYERELLEIEQFGLDLQLKYFKLGNEDILVKVDDPDSNITKNVVNSNVRTLIKNYNLYLDEINNEDSFSEEGKQHLAEGIDIYFPKLIEGYPSANYGNMENKIDLMMKKSNSETIKTSLKKIKVLIETKKYRESKS